MRNKKIRQLERRDPGGFFDTKRGSDNLRSLTSNSPADPGLLNRQCAAGIYSNSSHKIALVEDWDSGETISFKINGTTVSVKNTTSTNFVSGDVAIIHILDDCSIEPDCCKHTGANSPISTPCSDCSCGCVEQFTTLELIIPARVVSGNATIDQAEIHTLIHDGANWLGGKYEGSCSSGTITVTDTISTDSVARTDAGGSSDLNAVCEDSNCNPPFAISVLPSAPAAQYAYNSLLTTGDREDPDTNDVKFYKMTVTDGTDTYVCTATTTAVKGGGSTYTCELLFRVTDETGAATMNIFPATLDSLDEVGASVYESSLSFQTGVVTLAHSNDVTMNWDVVADAGNPAWPGLGGLPWSGDFDIRDSSETPTDDTITVTIEELPG